MTAIGTRFFLRWLERDILSFLRWLFWLIVYFLQVIKQAVSELRHSSSVAIMVKSERLWTTDRASNFSEVKQRSKISVLQIHRQRRPGKCVFLCDLDWQLAIKTSETAPIAAPIYPVYSVRQPNNDCEQAYFFLPSPSLFPILTRQPPPWNQFLTRPNSRSVWTSKSIAL